MSARFRRPQWEYLERYVNLADARFNSAAETMDELGQNGWEIFHVRHGSCSVTLYAKRPRRAARKRGER